MKLSNLIKKAKQIPQIVKGKVENLFSKVNTNVVEAKEETISEELYQASEEVVLEPEVSKEDMLAEKLADEIFNRLSEIDEKDAHVSDRLVVTMNVLYSMCPNYYRRQGGFLKKVDDKLTEKFLNIIIENLSLLDEDIIVGYYGC